MGISVKSSGSQTATLDTEHTLLATTDPGVYVLSVDVSALAVNTASSQGHPEIVELRVKKKVRTGDTIRQVYFATLLGGALVNPIIESPPISAPFGATFTLKQITTTSGTGRAFPWSVEQLDA